MLGGVGADGGDLRLGAGEVQTGMAGEVVVGAVLHAVGHGVGGGNADGAVSKDDPNHLGGPLFYAADLVHLLGVQGGEGLDLRVLAKGEHVHLPGDAAVGIVQGGVGVLAGLAAHGGVPVLILHLAGHGVVGLLRGGGGIRAAHGGGAAGVVQRRDGVLAGNAVGGEGVGPLEFLHGLVGQAAVDAVRRAGEIAQGDELLLHDLDCVALVALAQDVSGNIHGGEGFGGVGHGGGAVKDAQGVLAGDGVAHQAVLLLEVVDGFSGIGAVDAVRRAGEVAQLDQPLLHGLDVLALVTLAQGLVGDVQAASQLAVVHDGAVGVEEHLGVIAGDAVGGEAVLGLEEADGRHIVLLALAVLGGGVVAQLLQALLQAEDFVARHALLDEHHIVLGDFLVGVLLFIGGGGHDGVVGLLVGGQAQVGEQHGCRAAAAHAVGLEAVFLLEGLQGRDALGAEDAVRLAGEVFQVDQPLLHQLGVIALGALAHGGGGLDQLGQGRGGSRGLGGGGGVDRDAVAVEELLGGGAAHAVGLEAVLRLEGLHRGDGGAVISAVDGAGVVTLGIQDALHRADEHALVAGAHSQPAEDGQGLDFGFHALGVVGLAGEEQGLQIRVGIAGDGQAVLLLEGHDRVGGAGAIDAIRAALEEAQLNEGLLQGGDLVAVRAGLEQLVAVHRGGRGGGGAGLGGRRGGHDGRHLDVILHDPAGLAVIGHVGPGAAELVDGDGRALGDGVQLFGGGGGRLAQIDAAGGDSGVGIARRRQPGGAGGGHLGLLHILLEDIASAAVILNAVEIARCAGDFHNVALGDAADDIGSIGVGGGAHIGVRSHHARVGIAGCAGRDGGHHQQQHRQEQRAPRRLHPMHNSHIESSVFLSGWGSSRVNRYCQSIPRLFYAIK